MGGLKTLGVAATLLFATQAYANENNLRMKECVESTADYTSAASCYHKVAQEQNNINLAKLRDFLAANPRYMYPGQSNNRCWGKEREMPFESATLTAGPWGFTAGVSYKDTMPAGCYETGPWDNRDVK